MPKERGTIMGDKKMKCIDGNDLVEKKPKNVRGPTGPGGPTGATGPEGPCCTGITGATGPEHEPLVCGRLFVAITDPPTPVTLGPLAVGSGHNIAAIREGCVPGFPGVRSWIITSGPVTTAQAAEGLAFLGQAIRGGSYQDIPWWPLVKAPVVQIPAGPGLVQLEITIYLVDGSGTPIDPADPQFNTPHLVTFEIIECGTEQLVATPADPPC